MSETSFGSNLYGLRPDFISIVVPLATETEQPEASVMVKLKFPGSVTVIVSPL